MQPQSCANINSVCSPSREVASVLPSAHCSAIRRTAHHVLQTGDTHTAHQREREMAVFQIVLQTETVDCSPMGRTLQLLSAWVSSRGEWLRHYGLTHHCSVCYVWIISTHTNELHIYSFSILLKFVQILYIFQLSNESTFCLKVIFINTMRRLNDLDYIINITPVFGTDTATCIVAVNTILDRFILHRIIPYDYTFWQDKKT